MMKLYSSSPLYLRRPLYLLFSTAIKPPPSSSASPLPRLTFLQSVLDEIKLLSVNPTNCSSLNTLDSLLAKTHFLDPATSLILIDFLSQINEHSRCKTLISQLKSRGRVSKPFLFSLVFDLLAKDDKINDVKILWEETCGSVKGFNFSEYVILVCKFGGIDEIKDISKRILMSRGICLERKSYVVLSAALCNVNEGILAAKIVEQMVYEGFKVDNRIQFLIFQCYCRNGAFGKADMVLKKLVRNGYVADIDACEAYIHGLCKWGKYTEANKLFKKLTDKDSIKGYRGQKLVLVKGKSALFQLNFKGVVSEIMVYESYFRALCAAMKIDGAKNLLKKMMSGKILNETCVYGSFIKGLFRVGRIDDAMNFFNMQREKGLVRVDELGRYAIMGLCEKGKTDDALRLFEEILSVNGFENSSDVCNIILGSYWKQNNVANAELFFEKWLLDEGNYGKLDVTTYTIMLNGYCSSNDVSKALGVLEEMLKRKMVVTGATYEGLVRFLCDCGRINEAFHYLNYMIEKGHLVLCKRWRRLFQSVLSIDEHRVLIGS